MQPKPTPKSPKKKKVTWLDELTTPENEYAVEEEQEKSSDILSKNTPKRKARRGGILKKKRFPTPGPLRVEQRQLDSP